MSCFFEIFIISLSLISIYNSTILLIYNKQLLFYWFCGLISWTIISIIISLLINSNLYNYLAFSFTFIYFILISVLISLRIYYSNSFTSNQNLVVSDLNPQIIQISRESIDSMESRHSKQIQTNDDKPLVHHEEIKIPFSFYINTNPFLNLFTFKNQPRKYTRDDDGFVTLK